MNKSPREIQLFLAICFVIASIAMIAVSVYCYATQPLFGFDDTCLGQALLSLIAIPLTSIMMLLSAFLNKETSRMMTVIRNTLIGCPIAIVIIYSVMYLAEPLKHSDRHYVFEYVSSLLLIPVLMIVAVNIMNYITIHSLRYKSVWTLYAVAQTLFLIHCWVCYYYVVVCSGDV